MMVVDAHFYICAKTIFFHHLFPHVRQPTMSHGMCVLARAHPGARGPATLCVCQMSPQRHEVVTVRRSVGVAEKSSLGFSGARGFLCLPEQGCFCVFCVFRSEAPGKSSPRGEARGPCTVDRGPRPNSLFFLRLFFAIYLCFVSYGGSVGPCLL